MLKPLFIFFTIIGICAARWAAVFPLSKAINWFIRYRAKRRGKDVADELPHSYQVMLFWAGLRGAVGVALAASLKTGPNVRTLQATILIVVVLTVIIFGGTTARMLEIMGIKTGVVEEIDSDDEFDIETTSNGTYYKSTGSAVGHLPQRGNGAVQHDQVNIRANGGSKVNLSSYSSGSNSVSPPVRPTSANSRKNSTIDGRERDATMAQQNILGHEDGTLSDEEIYSDSDLPPAVRTRSPKQKSSPPLRAVSRSSAQPQFESGRATPANEAHLSASDAISQLFSGTTEEHAAWFTQLDEGFIKPKLLLDQNRKGGGSGGNV